MSTQVAGPLWAAALAVPLALFGFAPRAAVSGGDVAIQMKNVDSRIADDIVLEIRALRGALKPLRASRSLLTM